MKNIHIWEGKTYLVSEETPENGDFVLTEDYGVWIFQDLTGTNSASMPYWANKNACKKLILINEHGSKKRSH